MNKKIILILIINRYKKENNKGKNLRNRNDFIIHSLILIQLNINKKKIKVNNQKHKKVYLMHMTKSLGNVIKKIIIIILQI